MLVSVSLGIQAGVRICLYPSATDGGRALSNTAAGGFELP